MQATDFRCYELPLTQSGRRWGGLEESSPLIVSSKLARPERFEADGRPAERRPVRTQFFYPAELRARRVRRVDW